MAKSYKDSVEYFKGRILTMNMASLLPILNGVYDNYKLMSLCLLLYALMVHESINEYKKIGDCKEFQELYRIYQDILISIKTNMGILELDSLEEQYLYFRYLVENNYLSLDKTRLTKEEISFAKNRIAAPLSFNGHEIPSSYALLLEDILRSSITATASVKGKIIKTGIEQRETNNHPGLKVTGSRVLSTKEKIITLNKKVQYLTVADSRSQNEVYFLNPNNTEVYTSLNESLDYLISDKGNIIKVMRRDENYPAIDEDAAKRTINDLMAYKDSIIKRIGEKKTQIDEMYSSIEYNLRDAESIYKKLVL